MDPLGFFQYTGDLFGQASTAFIGKPIQFVGQKLNSHFITDIGNSVEEAGEASWNLVGRAGDGLSDTLYGTFSRDTKKKEQGIQSLKHVVETAGTGIEATVTNTTKNVRDIYEGAVHKDYDQLKSGGQHIVKLMLVGTVTIGIIDFIGDPSPVIASDDVDRLDVSKPTIDVDKQVVPNPATWAPTVDVDTLDTTAITPDASSDHYFIETINAELDGENHDETRVPFESQTIELNNGDTVTGVFPDFNEVTAVTIPESLYLESDYYQFEAANSVLAQRVEVDPAFRAQFSSMQLEQIALGETPDGYVWHHHETPGRLELVDESIHANTGHTGGRLIWGGGSEYR